MSKIIGFDCETYMSPDRGKAETQATPRLVCLSYHVEGEAAPVVLGRADAVRWFVERIEEGIADDAPDLVAHNAPFDLRALLRAAWEETGCDYTAEVMAWAWNGRIRDTAIREMLGDIAGGGLTPRGYALDRLVAHYFPVEGAGFGGASKKDPWSWRFRYAELADVPVDAWPRAAYDYAAEDATWALRVFQAQVDPLNETWQMCAHLWLSLAAARGMRVDYDYALDLEAFYVEQAEEAARLLREHGVMDEAGTISQRVKRDLFQNAWALLGEEPERTDSGAIKTDAAVLDYLTEREVTGDPVFNALVAYNRAEKFRATYLEPLLSAGEWDEPLCPRYNPLVESGRTSAARPNVQNFPARSKASEEGARRKGYEIRGCIVPRPGHVFVQADYTALELVTLAQVLTTLFCAEGEVSSMAAAINAGVDPHLRLAAQLAMFSYDEAVAAYRAGDKRIKELRQTAKCFHPDTEVLTPRGWVRLPDLTEEDMVCAAKVHEAGSAGTVELVWERPSRLTQRPADELVEVFGQDSHLCVTPDHRIPTWTRSDVLRTIEASAWGEGDRLIACAGTLHGGEAPSEAPVWYRLAVATQADGSYAGRRVRFGFTKARKIERLRALCAEAGAAYVERVTTQGATSFVLDREASARVRALLDADKTLPWSWLALDEETRRVVVEEAEFWDGSTIGKGARSYHYGSTVKKNVDVLTALASTTGRKCRAHTNERPDPTHATLHKVAVKDRAWSRSGGAKVRRVAYDGLVYCLTVPSDAVLVRYKGTTGIAHQCANFGFPGGLGALSFKDFAKASYGVEVTEERAKWLRAAWFEAWPEMAGYFKWIERLKSQRAGGYVCSQHGPDRQTDGWRIRTTPSFTAACNTFFQGLAADGAKYVGWLLSKECYTDESSPLFGGAPVLYVHDEFVLEIQEHNAEAGLARLKEVMIKGMRRFTPDVAVRVEGQIMYDRWTK